MTQDRPDDLEPRLTDHLNQRASRVSATADVADVHHRIARHQRRRTRALGTALAIALVAGPVLGWSLARSSEPDRDTLTAAGGDGAGSSGGGPAPTFPYGEYLPQGSADLDFQLVPVSARTTEAGIRLVVHSTQLSQSNGPCEPDGYVRVGISDGDLIDVLRLDTAPGGASFLVAGAIVDDPMWVVAVRGFESVQATFPNGATDSADATDGLAVLAAYADDGQSPQELADDVIELRGDPMTDMGETDEAHVADGSGGCGDPGTVPPPTEPPVLVMPEPGEPPADEDAARADIEELFSGYGGQDPDSEMDEHERPNVWRDADTRFREEYPGYLQWAKESYLVPLEIVFTAPDRATVRYEVRSDNPEIPTPGQRLGEAVLIDGVWKVSIETSCADIALAGIECDYSIEG